MLLIQMTGLSGAGKTTLSREVAALLPTLPIIIVDGDAYRQTLSRDLGFSKEDRCENIRRLGKVGADFAAAGKIAIIAAINPYESSRQELEEKYGALTVWVNCDMERLVERDTKGLYRRAALPEGHEEKLHNLTGVNDPFEVPLNADLTINTHLLTVAEAARLLAAFITARLPQHPA